MSGIIFLTIATICAAMFSIIFKIFHIKNVDSLQAIFFNYVTAFLLGLIFSLNGDIVENPLKQRWLPAVMIMGFVFVAGMVLLSASTKRVGVAISTVCSRASMIIPIIVSYLLIEGSAKPKWLPILLVLIAMTMTIWTGRKATPDHKFSVMDIIAPLVVFLTFGLSNSMLKVVQNRVSLARADWSDAMINKELSLVTACIFFMAMLICSVSFFRKGADGKRTQLQFKNVLGGVALGSANYLCTYTLMLSMKSIDSSILFPFHNLGIVAIGALTGWICFHEKMRPHQIAGILLAAVALFWLCM